MPIICLERLAEMLSGRVSSCKVAAHGKGSLGPGIHWLHQISRNIGHWPQKLYRQMIADGFYDWSLVSLLLSDSTPPDFFHFQICSPAPTDAASSDITSPLRNLGQCFQTSKQKSTGSRDGWQGRKADKIPCFFFMKSTLFVQTSNLCFLSPD